jgi:hypothetical protein
MLTDWYSGQTRKLDDVSGTVVWYHNGMPPTAIRWVLVHDPSGQHHPQTFLCTDLDLEPTAVLQRFVSRWWIETTFQEARELPSVETQRQWSDFAILRTTLACSASTLEACCRLRPVPPASVDRNTRRVGLSRNRVTRAGRFSEGTPPWELT